MRIFGIDPGSERTGYGCVETDGRRHRLVACGAITAPPGDAFPASAAPGFIASSRALLADAAGPTASPSRTCFTRSTPAAR